MSILKNRILAVVVGLGLLTCLMLLGCSELPSTSEIPAVTSTPEFTLPFRSIDDIKKLYGPEERVPDCSLINMSVVSDLQPETDRKRMVIATSQMRLANRQMLLGNYREARNRAEEALHSLNDDWDLSRANFSYLLARVHAFSGELDRAKSILWKANNHQSRRKAHDRSYYVKWKTRHDVLEAVGNASVAHATGRYGDAELLYRRAIGIYESKPHEFFLNDASLYADLGEVMLLQGRPVEAEAMMREAVRRSGRGLWGTASIFITSPESALFATRLARILSEQRRYTDAEWLYRRAINIYQYWCTPIGSLYLAKARQSMAENFVAPQRWQEALEQFNKVEEGVKRVEPETFERLFSLNADWSNALLKTGHDQTAVEKLKTRTVQFIERHGETHYATVEARGLLGVAHYIANNRSGAKREFERAVPVLIKSKNLTVSEAGHWAGNKWQKT